MSESDSSLQSFPIKETGNSSTNPFDLIKKMNKIINDQKKQIQQYELALGSLTNQKQILLDEKQKVQRNYKKTLQKFQQFVNQSAFMKRQDNKPNNLNLSDNYTHHSQISHRKSVYKNLLSPKLRNQTHRIPISVSNVKLTPNSKKQLIQHQQQKYYIPQPIILNKQTDQKLFGQDSSNTEILNHSYAQNFIEDFIVIGPQVNQFKNIRSSNKNKSQDIVTDPCALFSYNKFYKTKKSQFLKQIANRAFPESCLLKRNLIERHEDLYNLIDFQPSNKLSSNYFVFTLKGDQSLSKRKNKGFVDICNSNNYLYVFCVKLPQIIYVRDQKNYHRKQSEVWITQKVYAIATYYPFFSILVSLLSKIHQTLSKQMIRKIIIQNQSPLLWGLTKNIYDLQENKDIRKLLQYFSHRRPEPNQIFSINNTLFGYIPENIIKLKYAVAYHTCPIFFSSICYQQMLLLLTAVFLEKTLIFVSKDQSLSSMCALFFTNIIYPFNLDTILLNCDSSRIDQLIFQYPFSMMCSVKKTDKNFQKILYLFAESNVERASKSDARYIFIDIDSNTILYHQVLEEKLAHSLISLSQKLEYLYKQINDCEPRSLSTTKALHRQVIGSRQKPRTEKQKKQQQKKKYTKEYIQKIHNNKIKSPTYELQSKHEKLLKLLIQQIQSLTIDEDIYREEIYGIKNKNTRRQTVKNYLTDRSIHKNKSKFIQSFIQTQIYANYLDSFTIENNVR